MSQHAGSLLHIKTDVAHAIFVMWFCHTRAWQSQTLPLSSCTLRLCRINKHGFSTIFPISPSSFTNTVPKWWNCSISNLFWTLRLIICFRFTRQPTKTKLLPRISSVWFVYATVTACNCAVARCDFIARQNHAIKSQVWHRSKTHSPVNIYTNRHEMNELLQISIL